MTGAKRLRQKVQDLEKELSEQKLVNQQQTLILLELIKVTNLNVQGIHFKFSVCQTKCHLETSSAAYKFLGRYLTQGFLMPISVSEKMTFLGDIWREKS